MMRAKLGGQAGGAFTALATSGWHKIRIPLSFRDMTRVLVIDETTTQEAALRWFQDHGIEAEGAAQRVEDWR